MTLCGVCSPTVQPHVRVKRGQHHQQALHIRRAIQHHYIARAMFTHSAALSAYEKGPAVEPAWHFL